MGQLPRPSRLHDVTESLGPGGVDVRPEVTSFVAEAVLVVEVGLSFRNIATQEDKFAELRIVRDNVIIGHVEGVEVSAVFILHSKSLEAGDEPLTECPPGGEVRERLEVVRGGVTHMGADPPHPFHVGSDPLGGEENGHGVQPRVDVFLACEGGDVNWVLEGCVYIAGLV